MNCQVNSYAFICDEFFLKYYNIVQAIAFAFLRMNFKCITPQQRTQHSPLVRKTVILSYDTNMFQYDFPVFSSKESTCNVGDAGSILGQEDPLEEGIKTHSRIPAWEIPQTEGPGGLQQESQTRLGNVVCYSQSQSGSSVAR